METTLLRGDRVLVQRWPKPIPKRGDVLVFLYPLNRRQVYVKRVIGVPGDRLRIVNKVVYRDGAPLQELYRAPSTPYVDAFRDFFPSGSSNMPLPAPARQMLTQNVVNGELVVPAANYFVLGDNRDDSSDSRYWGFVPSGDVIGRPFLIYDSLEQPVNVLVKPTADKAGRAGTGYSRFYKRFLGACRFGGWVGQASSAAPLF